MTLEPSTTPLTHFSLLSFDVYGTLVDWETGISNAILTSTPFQFLPKDHSLKDRTVIIKAYEKLERSIQAANPALEYSELLSQVYRRLCTEQAIPASSAEIDQAAKHFADSVKSWPLFPDTLPALRKLQKRYKLVPLSNSSPSTFGASLAGPFEGFKFDAVYLAADIGSYKPDLRNFDYLVEHVKSEFGVEKGRVLHVAQSLFHDHVPAGKMGLERCWVDREGVMGEVSDDQRKDVTVNWVVKSLGELAETMEKAFEEEGKRKI
jgi:2-haloalkanoic acid dehalogenase type II